MDTTAKHQSMISFLRTCPIIRDNILYFNFGSITDDANQIMTGYNDIALHKQHIDGSVARRYTINIDSFKSVTANPMATVGGLSIENESDFASIQQLTNWVEEQAELHNFPDFGSECIVDSMSVLSSTPSLLGVDSSLNPPMAIYRTTIRVDYLDKSACVWH